MDIRPIRTEADYAWAMQAFEALKDAPPGSAEADRLEVLITLIGAYESARYLSDPVDPIETLKFEMERQGLTAKDLVPMIGQPNRVYEVLSGKRQLSLPMIRRLHRGLGIPLEFLLAEPKAS